MQKNGSESDENLNRLEPSFAYSKVLKKIILNMRFNEKSRQSLVNFCQEKFAENPNELKMIERFSREYRPDEAISWFEEECLLYRLVNRSLLLLEGDVIVKMAFYIYDLYQQIEEVHRKQVRNYSGKTLMVFRGQELPMIEFKKLKKNSGGLFAFNYFVSGSLKQKVALKYAKHANQDSNMVTILFAMTIDSKLESIPFVDTREYCSFPDESTIVFSMNTVFRIGQIRCVEGQNRLFEVQLTLTTDRGPQLRKLVNRMEEELAEIPVSEKLGALLMKLEQPITAEDFHHGQRAMALDEATSHCRLAKLKMQEGKYQEAIEYYKRAFDIRQKHLPSVHPVLAESYNEIGDVYLRMHEHSKALACYDKALSIAEKVLPTDHPDLGVSYRSLGEVHKHLGQYTKALSYSEKSFPTDKPVLEDLRLAIKMMKKKA